MAYQIPLYSFRGQPEYFISHLYNTLCSFLAWSHTQHHNLGISNHHFHFTRNPHKKIRKKKSSSPFQVALVQISVGFSISHLHLYACICKHNWFWLRWKSIGSFILKGIGLMDFCNLVCSGVDQRSSHDVLSKKYWKGWQKLLIFIFCSIFYF